MTMYVLLNMYIQYVPPIERLWIEEWIKDDKKFTTISLKVAASEQVLKTLVKSIEESWRQDPECYSEEASKRVLSDEVRSSYQLGCFAQISRYLLELSTNLHARIRPLFSLLKAKSWKVGMLPAKIQTSGFKDHCLPNRPSPLGTFSRNY